MANSNTPNSNSCGPLLDHSKLTLSKVHSVASWEVNSAAELNSISANVVEEDVYKLAYVVDAKRFYALISVFPAQWVGLGGDTITQFSYSETRFELKIVLSSGEEFIVSLAPLVEKLQQEFNLGLEHLDLELKNYVNDLINNLDIADLVDVAVGTAITQHNQDDEAHAKLDGNVKELVVIQDQEYITNTRTRYYADSTTAPIEIRLPILDDESPDYDPDVEMEVGSYMEVLAVGTEISFTSADLNVDVIDQRVQPSEGNISRVTVTLLNDGDEDEDQEIPPEFDGKVVWLISTETATEESGSAVWGKLSGVLEDQEDLKAALDSKADKDGFDLNDYVRKDELNDLIQAYLDSIEP